MKTADIEKRLTNLEREVAHLRSQNERPRSKARWWEKIAGSFANDPLFEEAMRLGRKWRESQRPNIRRVKRRNGKNGHP
jgi:hypothetical protein